MKLADCRNVLQIDLLHDDLNSELPAKRIGESSQPVQPARHQYQRVTALGILTGKLFAEAARCACNENPRFICWFHFGNFRGEMLPMGECLPGGKSAYAHHSVAMGSFVDSQAWKFTCSRQVPQS